MEGILDRAIYTKTGTKPQCNSSGEFRDGPYSSRYAAISPIEVVSPSCMRRSGHFYFGTEENFNPSTPANSSFVPK